MKAPTKIGPYTLMRRLAVGGMAEIYLAKVAGLGGFEKHLVLKVLHAKYAQDPEFIEMLIQEAKLVVRLNHVNIAQVFDLGVHEDRYYIAMEYVDGPDLYQILRRCRETKTYMSFEVASYVIAEVCAGLGYAHDRKDEEGRPLDVIHRDISPQNILVSHDGEVKIIDFGIAKARARSTTTGEGIIKGKFFYMSPEQARGDPLDHRSDIFALGNLFYELVTNRMLYDTDSFRDALRLARMATFLPPSTLRNDLPQALEEIVLKALSRDRDLRYASAHLMRADISSWLRRSSPGFGRHRLADYVKQLFQTPRERDLPSMGRMDFLVQPSHSMIYRSGAAPDDAAQPPQTPSGGTRKVKSSLPVEGLESRDEPIREPFQADALDTRPRERIQRFEGVEAVEEVVSGQDITADVFKATTAVASVPPVTAGAQPMSTPEPAGTALRAALEAWQQSQIPVAQQTPANGQPSTTATEERAQTEDQWRGKASHAPGQVPPGQTPRPTGTVQPPWPSGSFRLPEQELSDEVRRQIRKAVSEELGLGPPDAEGQKATQEIPPDIIRSLAQNEKDRYRSERGVDEGSSPGAPPYRPQREGWIPGGEGASEPLQPGRQDQGLEDWEPTLDQSEVMATLRDPVAPGGRPGREQPQPVGAGSGFDQSMLGWLDTATEVQVEPGQFPISRPSTATSAERKASRAQVIILIVVTLLAVVAFVVFLVLAVSGPPPAPATTGSIQVTSSPRDGAQIYLNGVPTGMYTPSLLTGVPVGTSHEVRIWLPGYLEAVNSPIALSPGERREVELVLLPAVHSATIESAPPGAEILINNRVVGHTPFELTNINLEGKDGLRVLLRLDGYLPELFTIRWPPGEIHASQHRVMTPGP